MQDGEAVGRFDEAVGLQLHPPFAGAEATIGFADRSMGLHRLACDHQHSIRLIERNNALNVATIESVEKELVNFGGMMRFHQSYGEPRCLPLAVDLTKNLRLIL